MDLDKAQKVIDGIDPAVAAQNTAAVVIGVVLAVFVVRLIRRKRPLADLAKYKPSRADRALTFIGAVMASSMAAHTMFLVVGAQMPTWLKWGVVAFVEINTVAAALRSRQFRLLHAQRVDDLLSQDPTATPPARDRDIDGIAVWIIAAGSALLGYVEATSAVEAIARTAAPLIAAFSWERGLVGELRQFSARKASAIRWGNPLEALAVRFGLATPTDQYKTAAAGDRSRRLGLVVDAGYRAGVASRLPFKLNTIVDAYAHGRYHRRLRGMQRRFGFGAELLTEIRLGVAALRQADAAVADDQLAHLDPWGDPAADRKALDQALADQGVRAAEAEALRTELEQMHADARQTVKAADDVTAEARAAIAAAEARAEAAEAAAIAARQTAGGRDDLLNRMLTQARQDTEAARAEARTAAERHRAELDQVRAELDKARAGQVVRMPQFSAPALAATRATPSTSVTPVTISGLPAFDPARACGCLRNGRGNPCGWTLADHISRKADQVRMVLSYLETNVPEWATRTERVGKSDVELACRTNPNDPNSSIAGSSNVQNQVAWIFDDLRAIVQEQTTSV